MQSNQCNLCRNGLVGDHLQQEIEAAQATREATIKRKSGKHARCVELAKKMVKAEPAPMVDLLAVSVTRSTNSPNTL